MGMNPTRFAIGISGALACLGIGLAAGVSAGTSHAAHLYDVRTVTTTATGRVAAAAKTVTVAGSAPRRADAAMHTITQTVVRTVTVPVTVAAAAPPAGPAGGPHHHGHGHAHGPGHGDGPKGGPGPGPRNGPGADGPGGAAG